MWKKLCLLLPAAGCILFCYAKSAHTLEVTVRDGDVSVRMDAENPDRNKVTDGGVSFDGGKISLGNVSPDEQGTGIHRRTELDNVTVIQNGNKRTYIKHKTEEGGQNQ